MARKLRVQYPGAIYHVMNRGDRREPIVLDDHDRIRFLETLGQTCAKTGWHVHAFCLMHNHFHLVVETPQANLVAGMKWFLGTYTARFNRKHKLLGHLFAGRYKALPVDGSGNGYLRTVCDYVHLNPARAGLLREDEPLRAYRWSSYTEYLKTPGKRPEWLRVRRLLGELGLPRDSEAGRRQFQRRMEARRHEADPAEWKKMGRGWCLGDEAFRQELLAQMHEQLGEHHFGPERQESAEEKAERLVRAALKAAGLKEHKLADLPKGAPAKLAVARRLRAETTMPLKWIATRLHMGTWTYLNNRLYWDRRASR